MLDANDQLRSPEAYRQLIVAYRDGAPLRLDDVADVVDGAENRRLSAWADELPAVLVNVQRQPGANVIEVVDRIQALLPQLTASLPERRSTSQSSATAPGRFARRCATCSASSCSPSRSSSW